MDSIIQKDLTKCYVCGCSGNLHKHHIIYGTANRKNSEEYGLTVMLCPAHHNMSNNGVHFNKKLDLKLKQLAEKMWIEKWDGHVPTVQTGSNSSMFMDISKFTK